MDELNMVRNEGGPPSGEGLEVVLLGVVVADMGVEGLGRVAVLGREAVVAVLVGGGAGFVRATGKTI